MIKDTTRRDLLAKLGLGAAGAVTVGSLAMGQALAQTRPARLKVDPLRSIEVEAPSSDAFAISVIGTTAGFLVSKPNPLESIDKDRLGVSKDRRALQLGVMVRNGQTTLIGLDDLLRAASDGRCHYSAMAGTDVINPDPTKINPEQLLRF